MQSTYFLNLVFLIALMVDSTDITDSDTRTAQWNVELLV